MDKQVEVEVPLDGPDDLLDAVSPLVRAAYKMNAESTGAEVQMWGRALRREGEACKGH